MGSINDLGGGVRVLATKTDFSPGPLKSTGIPTDFAIQGDGYFVVNKDGHAMLSRAGNFTFNAENQLVDTSGHLVMSDVNAPVTIDPEAGPWQLTPDGGILQSGDVTPLALVRPKSPGDLAKHGENLFLPLGPTEPLDAEERSVVGGTLETSGIKPTMEMMELIESTRAFEANVNMIRSYDQMIDTLVSRVLKES
jgi:flagellar basal body rod protein FlgG